MQRQSLAAIGKGCPDLIVGRDGKNFLIEVKDHRKCPSAKRLTPDQEAWHEQWNGQVAIVEDVDEALRLVEPKEVE